jgi:hypothetical protein
MGQAERTTKLRLDLGEREQGGANQQKRIYLEETAALLNAARSFYLDFFLAHAAKLSERVQMVSKKTGEVREAVISADKLLTWAENLTVETREHPHPDPTWNFSARFPGLPWEYRRSVIKDCIGKAKAYLTAHETWKRSSKKKGKPGRPTPCNHPTLYEGTFSLMLDTLDLKQSFVRLGVYTGQHWEWIHYPTHSNRFFEERRAEPEWEALSPKLVLKPKRVEIHFPQKKRISAKKIVESKQDPDLVTVAVDLNVKNLAVVTVRQHGKILKSVFLTDHGLDQHRYRHLKRIARKQWQAGKAVKGEHSNRQIWQHVRRMNRRQANQLRGKINQYSKDKAYAQGTVTVEVNPADPGQARMQMSMQFKVVGLVAGPKGARSSLCALSDITQANTVLEYGRNARMGGLVWGGTNSCPGLLHNSGNR